MKIAVDTNVLLCAEGVNDPGRQARAAEIFKRLPPEGVILPVQVLGELFNVLARQLGFTAAQCRARIQAWQSVYRTIDTTQNTIFSAADLVVRHRLSIWDAVIISAAVEARCQILLSEDMHDGFSWHGLTVVNPFAHDPHPLLAPVFGTPPHPPRAS